MTAIGHLGAAVNGAAAASMPNAWLWFCAVAGLLFAGTVGKATEPALVSPRRVPADTLPPSLPWSAEILGLESPPAAPPESEPTEARVALGRKLFFDERLSKDRSLSCAGCHDPAHGFADSRPRAMGVLGQVGLRNAPSLFNRAYARNLFWDGRETSLERQALAPIENPLELGNSVSAVVEDLRADEAYTDGFAKAFPDGLTAENIGRALASFERTLLLGDNGVDRFHAGQVGDLSDSARKGMWLFQSRGKCWRCHSGPNLSDERFHNTGVSWGADPQDLGRFEVTHDPDDRGRFKTPSLRGVALSPPYMHDGSLATLTDVVKFYSQGGGKNPHLDAMIAPLNLAPEEIEHLVALLEALTGRTAWQPSPDSGSNSTWEHP